MKLMIFAIDALPPDVLFNNMDMFPNIKKIKQDGMYCEYDTYTYGYGSRDNWISLYTGLTPDQHGVINNKYKYKNRYPNINDYKDKKPFWTVLNEYGLTVGMWKGLVTTPPDEINGYMISGEINYEADAETQDEYTSIDPVVNKKDKNILEFMEKNIIGKQPLPKSAKDFGYSWNEIKSKSDILDGILKDNYFHEAVEYLKENLDYYERNIVNVQYNVPVDICFFYTQLIDYIGHFQLHDLKKKEVINAIKIIDDFVGKVVSKINPDNVMILSDHGIKGWHEGFGDSSQELQKEMFGLRDNAIWLKNGAVVIEARNKGFLSACHDIKGTFIVSGKDIKKGNIDDMRTVDFYPTLLEMFGAKIPAGRQGFVLDIFKNKEIVNKEKMIMKKYFESALKIAIIQNIDIPDFNKVVNEVFLNNRFSKITVLGEDKYRQAFLCNPRINEFMTITRKIDKEIYYNFDKIIIPYKNVLTNTIDFYEM